MKKYIVIITLFAVVLTTNAQSVPAIQSKQPWKLGYDHEENKLPVAVYLNGSKIKNFTLSEITLVSTNGTNSYSFTINMPGVDRGFHRVNLTAIDTDGTESVLSAPLDLRAKPNAPFNLKIVIP